ncbi:MAG: hypothetical protein KA319_03440 [Ferruginibacter sp.]|nr:hypothetical protein [Ferruginibacter sp.]
MKLYALFFLAFFCNSIAAQQKLDTLLGENGVFKTLKSKSISLGTKVAFNIKLSFTATAKEEQSQGAIYLNTKDGFIGVDFADNNHAKLVAATNADVDFTIYSQTKQNFHFYTEGKKDKWVESLPYMPTSVSVQVTVKKATVNIATAQQYLNNSVQATPYYNVKSKNPKQELKYLYGKNLPADGTVKNYLGTVGIGFYNINGLTFLCLGSQSEKQKVVVNKIENVNVQFDPTSFKNRTEELDDIMKEEKEEEDDVKRDTIGKKTLEEMKLKYKDLLKKKKKS